jgi:ABC-type lipoprotein release transport system permease subunit
LLIAATGIGGVLAFSVSQRRREIGVRLALGAQRRDVLGLVLRQGGKMVPLGLGVGTLGAIWLAKFMQGLPNAGRGRRARQPRPGATCAGGRSRHRAPQRVTMRA